MSIGIDVLYIAIYLEIVCKIIDGKTYLLLTYLLTYTYKKHFSFI